MNNAQSCQAKAKPNQLDLMIITIYEDDEIVAIIMSASSCRQQTRSFIHPFHSKITAI